MKTKISESSLPPNKRYKYLKQESNNHHQFSKINYDKSPASPELPAKKRKTSRIPPLLPPSPPHSSIYCLPAKKRIYALHPFDLNLEPKTDENIENKKCPENIEGSDQICDTKIGIDDDDDDDGIVCSVCYSTDGDHHDPIVLCDGCDVMVHCTCYGHPLTKGVPEGDWFCDQCVSSKSLMPRKSSDSCCLCPVSGGAMKPTVDGKWAHIVCALFVPEVFFEDPEGREGIDCSKVPERRFEGLCYLCELKNGCVLDCSEPKCPLSFHVTCGLNEDLYVEYQQGKKKSDVVAGFCRKHTDLWQKQQQTGKFKIVARD
ncbi:zinc finger transcription factor [Lithospermum erythrorhizon]|uniref:Zinc finger transcription factor n=1 Tax=Lithospermum erythrorhizon TaxID=34254 RepID=A0AAV3RMC7_LITER